jgi:glycogen phosphorylase
MIREWIDLAQRPEFRQRVVFLEDYDIALAQELVQGVDVWINTPRRPWEACGTSGMKVLVNGGLNLSTRDGGKRPMRPGSAGQSAMTRNTLR